MKISQFTKKKKKIKVMSNFKMLGVHNDGKLSFNYLCDPITGVEIITPFRIGERKNVAHERFVNL